MDTSIKKALNKAVFQLYKEFPFWGFIMERCSIIFSTSVPTAGITPLGKMYINPTFLQTLTQENIVFLLAHEIQHVAMNHHARGKQKNHEIWNMATDYVINQDLQNIFNEIGMHSAIISGALLSEEYQNLTSEAVYEKIKTSTPKTNQNQDLIFGPGESKEGDKEVREARNPVTEEENKTGTKDWKSIALAAATSTKMYGKLAASIDREVLGNLVPKTNWNVILRRHLQDEYAASHKEDFSFSSYNRRQGSYIYRIPGALLKRNKKPIVYVVDTSGSMDDTEISQAIAELKCIQKTFDIDVYLMSCDAEVHEAIWLKGNQWNPPKMTGGGGTDFEPIFAHLKTKKMENSLVLIHTDGYGSFGSEPKNKVLWLLTTETNTPWGERILTK